MKDTHAEQGRKSIEKGCQKCVRGAGFWKPFGHLNQETIIKIHPEKHANISDEKIAEVFQALTDNPITAMGTVQALGIPTDKLQALMMMLMTNPSLIEEAVEELGLDFSKVTAAKAKLADE